MRHRAWAPGGGTARRLLAITAAAAAAVAGTLTIPTTVAASSRQSTIKLAFKPRLPKTAAEMRLHIVYRRPADPNGKPSPIRRLRITAPHGTRFHPSKVAKCSASNQQIQTEGRSACPAGSEVGHGTLTAITGVGPPADPVVTDAVLYNDGNGWIETFTKKGTTDPVIAIDRVRFSRNVMTGTPPNTPGGPPDGQTAVRTVDFTLPAATGFVTTPRTCPAKQRWITAAAFRFADGTKQVVRSSSPCKHHR